MIGRLDLLADVKNLTEQWRHSTGASPRDRLRARWVAWLLTSTIRPLRDQATSAPVLVRASYARSSFDLTLDSLAINDVYVPERLLAASYGVAMAHQLPQPDFAHALSFYLTGLRDRLIGADASTPTNHWLARLYVEGTANLAEDLPLWCGSRLLFRRRVHSICVWTTRRADCKGGPAFSRD